MPCTSFGAILANYVDTVGLEARKLARVTRAFELSPVSSKPKAVILWRFSVSRRYS
jgi:hypothetical protein